MADDENGPLSRAQPPIRELLGEVVRRIAKRSRLGLRGAADNGRLRLELRQLLRDRDNFWARLGKTAWRLQESGEINHPALEKAMSRIQEIESKIHELETKISTNSEQNSR